MFVCGFSGEYDLDEIGDTLKIYENKFFYPIAMEAREAPELSTCQYRYDKVTNMTHYTSNGTIALKWYLKNKKVVMIPRQKLQGEQGTPKKKKIVPTLMVVPDDF